jgi:hypothetical protein
LAALKEGNAPAKTKIEGKAGTVRLLLPDVGTWPRTGVLVGNISWRAPHVRVRIVS